MTISTPRQVWQQLLLDAVTDPATLLQMLALDPQLLDSAKKAGQLFPLKVPRSFIARMKKGDINDPLLRQVLPIAAELTVQPGFTMDPLAEATVNPVSGLLHKYQGRVLMIVTGACAINCRYCFRRHFPYNENNPGKAGWQQAFDYIANDASIHEVILSGGDPLLSTDQRLQEIVQAIVAIPHVQALRIHTRFPIVLPERITTDLIRKVFTTRLNTVLVTHSNHAQELDDSVRGALRLLKESGVTLLNQAVLLKGVNDTVMSQVQLSKSLFASGVLPYYLHLLDKVQGANHFDVSESTAKKIISQMREQLPGYLIPRLVKEQAGEKAKVVVG